MFIVSITLEDEPTPPKWNIVNPFIVGWLLVGFLHTLASNTFMAKPEHDNRTMNFKAKVA
jgi:hypothetical protein